MKAIAQKQKITTRKGQWPDIIAGFINAILITFVLVYIDEGLYNFDWMKDPGNWFMCGIYILIIFPSQYLMSKYLFGSLDGYKKVAYVSLLGFPLTLFLLWLLFRRWS